MNFLATSLVLASTLFVAAIQGPERTVVVPEDTTPFTVAEDEIVRLTGKGIAGSTIEAKVEGPAKIIAENAVSVRVKGRMPLGSFTKEFEVKPSGKGAVKVTISVKFPQPNQKPETATYEFTVE